MICIYEPDATDFTGNGLGALAPKSCKVTEMLNGEWELEMEHPLDEFGKWQRIVEGRIVRAPVPAAETPRIALLESVPDKEVYRVTTGGARLNLRSGTGTKYKILGAYKNGTEVVVLDKTTSSWYEVACPDGKRGYMYAAYLTYLRTETTVVGRDKVIEPKQMRDQPFRIYRVAPSLTGVKVYARHVFYDLADNMIQSYAPSSSDTGAVVAQGIASSCLSEHDFTFYSDLTTAAEDVAFENVNPVDALLGEEGFVEKYGAELVRDWFDVYLVARAGKDTDVQIREGKNLLGVTYDIDETDVVTQIMPTGETKDGKLLYLDDLYIDSPRIGSYPHPKWYHLAVSEAKVGDGMTAAQAKEKMRAVAQAEFDKGCDLPVITMTVSFVNCADTVEFAQYRALQNIFLGDTVSVIARRIGIVVAMRVTQYTFDCLTRKYDKIVLGVATEALEGSSITGKQLPNGEIRGTKLALGSVGAGQLQDGAVGSLKIKLAAIETAHIGDAAITNAKIGKAAIDTASIKDLAVTNAKIAALAVDSAKIANLAVTAAKIANAAIETAHIKDASITNAKIGTAAIETANIKDAAIETAKIALGAITTALIEKGAVGTAQIEDASITDAKIVSLSANRIDAGVLSVERLIIAGSDKSLVFAINNMGELVSSTVDTIDAYVLTQRTITADKIVAGAITADELAAACVIANKIAAGAIEAEKIAANAVTALKIASGAIQTTHISAGAWNALMLDAQERITLAVSGVRVGGVNLLRGTSGEYGAVSLGEYFTALTGRLALSALGLAAGDEITLSMSLKAPSVKAVSARITTYSAATGEAGKTVFAPGAEGIIPAGGAGRSVLTMTIPAGATHLEAVVANRTPENTATVTMQAGRVQLERGNRATDWSPHPEEFRAGSSIILTEEEVRIAAPRTVISVPKSASDSTEVARFDKDGVFAKEVFSPTVRGVYVGPSTIYVDPAATQAQVEAGTHFKSIAASLGVLNRRDVNYDVDVLLKQSTSFYETLRLDSMGGRGRLRFLTSGSPAAAAYATIFGQIYMTGCSGRITLEKLKVNTAIVGTNHDLIQAINCLYVYGLDLILTGNANTLRMVYGCYGTNLLVNQCEFYNVDATSAANRCLYADVVSRVASINSRGNMGGAYIFLANMGEVVATGTVPYTSGTQNAILGNGEIRAAGVTVDSGSIPPAVPPTTTYTYGVVDSRTHASDGGWFGSGDRTIRQGYTIGSKVIRGAMWFNLTTLRGNLTGKTPVSATISFLCLNNGIKAGQVLGLAGITNTAASGSIAGHKDYGALDAIAWGESMAMTIPTQAVIDLVAGTVNALCIYSGETAADLYDGRDYSKRYRRCEGYGTSGAPVLTVVAS